MRFSILGVAVLALVVSACGPPVSTGSRSRGGGSDAGSRQATDAGPATDAGSNQAQDTGSNQVQDTGALPPRDTGAPPTPNGCVERGTGNRTGSKLANLRLQNCQGDWIELHDQCGRPKVQFVVLVTEWCPQCERSMRELRGIEDEYSPEIDALYVLGELGRNQPATLEACSRVANAKGVRPEELLVDPSFATTLSGGWVRPCTDENGSFGLPQTNILDGRDMTLRWESMCDGRQRNIDPNTIINELMNGG